MHGGGGEAWWRRAAASGEGLQMAALVAGLLLVALLACSTGSIDGATDANLTAAPGGLSAAQTPQFVLLTVSPFWLPCVRRLLHQSAASRNMTSHFLQRRWTMLCIALPKT